MAKETSFSSRASGGGNLPQEGLPSWRQWGNRSMFMTELAAGGGNPRDVLAAASRRPSIHPSHQGLFFHIVSATVLPQMTPALWRTGTAFLRNHPADS